MRYNFCRSPLLALLLLVVTCLPAYSQDPGALNRSDLYSRGSVSYLNGQKELFILLLETGDDKALLRLRYSDYKLA